MKKILLGIVALLFPCITTLAQDISPKSNELSVEKVAAILKEAREQELNFIKQDAFSTNSQIRVGTGIMLPMIITHNTEDVFVEANGNRLYEEDRGFSLGVEYSYRVWDFLEIVGSLHYWGGNRYSELAPLFEGSGAYTKINTITNNEQFALGVYGRYNWFNSKWVSMYSTLGVWVMTTNATRQNTQTGDFERQWFTHCYAMPELTPFGIRVGRKFFGYFEPITLGARSNALNIGLGFRF